jgi:hypothetical protein
MLCDYSSDESYISIGEGDNIYDGEDNYSEYE